MTVSRNDSIVAIDFESMEVTMIQLTKDNTAKAIARCRKLKPKVEFVRDRVFRVTSSNKEKTYVVFFKVWKGQKLGQCECKASKKGMVCFHLIAGATANIYRQSLNRQTA